MQGVFDNDLGGAAEFSVYGGSGKIEYRIQEEIKGLSPSLTFAVNGLNLSRLVQSLSDEVYVSGIIDIDGRAAFTGEGPKIEAAFRSKPTRGVRQVMNFGAIKVISSIGGDSPVQTLGASDFRYNLFAGKITIQNDYLTIEGRAGERGRHQYIVRGGLFGGINLAIDREANTIRIEDLQTRIQSALDSVRR